MGQPTVNLDRAGLDVVDPSQALEEGALPAAVAPDDAEEFAPTDLDTDVIDGAQQVDLLGAEGV